MFAAVLSLFLFSILALPSVAQRVCNNSPLLCDRPYNKITHLGAHDSPFVRNASNGFNLAGNQYYPSRQQLSAGVRLLTGQIHERTVKGKQEWHLCHSFCELYDAGKLSDWLGGIKIWLDKHPTDVVTILLVNSDGATASQLGQQFRSAGIAKYAYKPPDTTKPVQGDWPTLNQLIDSDKRLIVFIQPLNPKTNTAAPYLLNQYTFTFENNYDVSDPSKFSCVANRPDQFAGDTDGALASSRLPLMNHFLYRKLGGGIEIPAAGRTRLTNAPNGSVGNLGDAADRCTKRYGAAPPFTLVDFFNNGPAIETVDRLNGVEGTVCGRKAVPQGIPMPGTSSASLTSSSMSLESQTGGGSGQTPQKPASTASPGSNAAVSLPLGNMWLLTVLSSVLLTVSK